ncbi:hypothetical protein [Flavobacterium sp. ACN6]|uniref:hypothetical protein n=1 Tax=Flavobacterium sp. ACN6 TaxID=1920426 RepID=UPI001C0F1FB9|nr:hypothetical protein [Flavobacterium sp. ACN6]PBJ12882.1 hypothetical protein BSF42_20630 [Flavobacterium sp. ACN6]
MSKIQFFILSAFYFFLISCNQKSENPASSENLKDEIEGTYTSEECNLSLIISKIKNDYQYVFKTSVRTLKGKASYSKNSSGEKYIVLEGIPWDEYEGDISNEEENDSIPAKELEIPVGIDAVYVKDTLTIQNYGNAMNSYTKISECGLKYILLVKK